jgi:hypothetical protein
MQRVADRFVGLVGYVQTKKGRVRCRDHAWAAAFLNFTRLRIFHDRQRFGDFGGDIHRKQLDPDLPSAKVGTIQTRIV